MLNVGNIMEYLEIHGHTHLSTRGIYLLKNVTGVSVLWNKSRSTKRSRDWSFCCGPSRRP